jgi:hypothetical protein
VAVSRAPSGDTDRCEVRAAGHLTEVIGAGVVDGDGEAGGLAREEVDALLAKLGLRDRIQAVVFAYEHGVVRPGSG